MLMAIGWKKLMNSMPLLGDEEAEDSAKETHVLEIQNGSLSSNQALNATLYNGTFLSFTSATSTMEDMREAAVQTIISQLIVPAWSLVADATGIGNIHPTIM
ncbi:MAG: hypothetical protein Q9157_007482 [Trypethelium eluteriae]